MRKFNGIYVLGDPRTGEVKYVGQTTRGLERCYEHLIDPARDRCHSWIRTLLLQGLLPTVEIIEEFHDESLLDEAEEFYIGYFRFVGAELLNATDGGNGAKGYRHAWTTKQVLRSYRGEKHHLFGKKREKSVCEKLSRSLSKQICCVNDGKVFPSAKDAAAFYDLSRGCVSLVCNGKQKHTKGLVFRFV